MLLHQAHPDNLVGIVIFGTERSGVAVYPTNDIEHVRKGLSSLVAILHFADLLKGIRLCQNVWYPYQDMKKRIVVFAGGYV